MNQVIEIKLTNNATLPTKGSEDAAAYDLKCLNQILVIKGELRLVKTGVHMSIPKGYYGQILSRSRLASKGIIVTGGVIDSDYRGEIIIIVQNISQEDYTFEAGDKVAQIAILKLFEGELKIVEDLSETKRGEGGFGSTGL